MYETAIQSIWKFVDFISRRKHRCILFYSLLSLILNGGITIFNGIPNPRVHDEFSYIFGAQTFAQGRITNPIHPLGDFFDTFHILQSPTRMSIYPPAQSFILAVGILIFGHPIAGVWISIAIMCAVLCWMFYAWLSPRWTFIASFLVLINVGFFTYWSHTYWGGACAAIGGGLVFGGLRYLYRSPTVWHSLTIGLGLFTLANSRPLEGFICGCISCLSLLIFFLKKKLPVKYLFTATIPLLSVITATCIQIGLFNKTVTGNPLTMPQRLMSSQLTSMPLFMWQKHPPEPTLATNWKTRYMNSFVLPFYNEKQKKYLPTIKMQIIEHLNFYSGFFLFSLVILTLPLCIRNGWFQFAIIAIFSVSFVDIFLITIANQPHYLAPLTGLFYFVAAQSLRSLSLLRLKIFKSGSNLIFYILLILSINAALNCLTNRSRPALFRKYSINKEWYTYKTKFEHKLRKINGTHVVIVPYGPTHNIHNEWIYNEPDIDNAKIIWARNIDPVKNQMLFKYYPERKFWVVLHEESTPELVAYTPELLSDESIELQRQ